METFAMFLVIIMLITLLFYFQNRQATIIKNLQDRNRDVLVQVGRDISDCVKRSCEENKKSLEECGNQIIVRIDEVLAKQIISDDQKKNSKFRDPETGLLSYAAYRKNLAREADKDMKHIDLDKEV